MVRCPRCNKENVVVDKEVTKMYDSKYYRCKNCNYSFPTSAAKRGKVSKEEKVSFPLNVPMVKEKIEWGKFISFVINLWKGIFLIPILLAFWYFLFLYEVPFWIPEVGGNTLIGYFSGLYIGDFYIDGFASTIGWIFLIIIFFASYAQIYREPFSIEKYMVRLLVHTIFIGIFIGIGTGLHYVPSVLDWIAGTGYEGCAFVNLITGKPIEWCKAPGEALVEKTNKIGGAAGYGSIDLKLGTKDLAYTITNPEAGKRYKLYFTVFNEMNKKIEGASISVKAGDVEATVDGCDYKKGETCELKEGENEFAAEFENIPETMINFRPVVDVKYKQNVEGINKLKIIWSETAYDLNYKPVCAQEEGKSYYCPASTQGPVDIIPSIIKKQIVVEENEIIDLTVRVWNKRTGYAYLSDAKIEQVVDTGYELSIDCQSDMFDRFTVTPKGSSVKPSVDIYGEYKDFYCDVTIPYKLSESEISKEVTVKVVFDYEYIYEFKEGPISVILL